MIIRKRIYYLVATISILIICATIGSLLFFNHQISKVKQRSTEIGERVFSNAIKEKTDAVITQIAKDIAGKNFAQQKEYFSSRVIPGNPDQSLDICEIIFITQTKQIISSSENRYINDLSNSYLIKKEFEIAEKGGGNEFYSDINSTWYIHIVKIPNSIYWYSIRFNLDPIIASFKEIYEPTISFIHFIAVGIITVTGILLFFIQVLSYPIIKRISILEEENISKNEELTQSNHLMNIEIEIRKRIEAELKAANHELKYISTTDSLTKLPNRRFFDQKFEKEWKIHSREKQQISLLMCDVDFFKKYNDTYGHQKGDDCLAAIAAIIRKTCKRPSDFVARYGGEEFVIILPKTDVEGAKIIAEEIRYNTEAKKIHHMASSIDGYVTVSIGLSSMIPQKGKSHDVLLKNADMALYRAKRSGRNRIEVSDS